MSALFLIIGFMAGGMALLLFLIKRSPVGYQDQTGFHLGYENGFVLPQSADYFTDSIPNNRSKPRSREDHDNDENSGFVFRFPTLIKAIGLTAILIVLVVLPKTFRNDGQSAALEFNAPPSVGQESLSAALTQPANELISVETTEVAFVIDAKRGSKFLPELCLRFSEVQ